MRLRERGFNVWGEYYPYAARSTTLNATFFPAQDLDRQAWQSLRGYAADFGHRPVLSLTPAILAHTAG